MSHYVQPIIDGDHLYLTFSCDEPPGSICRVTCPIDPRNLYGCEEARFEQIDGEWWHVGWSEADDEEKPLHKMVATSCAVLDWDCLDEGYAGESGPLRAGEITFSWSGDGYEWDYVVAAPIGEGER